MDKIIRKIYQEIIQDTEYMEEANQKVEEETKQQFKDEHDLLGEKKYEELRDKVFAVADVAEEEGFIQGFRYAGALIAELVLYGRELIVKL